MLRPINLPELGENIEEAEVLAVLVSVGDQIAKEQAIIEVETDKASVEVPSPVSGVVKAVRVAPGDAIRVGQVILEAESQDGEAAEPTAPSAAAPKADAETRRHGDAEKAPSAAAPAAASAAAAKQSGAPAETGEWETQPPHERLHNDREATEKETSPVHPAPETPVPAAPFARRLARELGLDLGDISGQEPDGYISAADVMRHARRLIQERRSSSARPPSAARSGRALPDFAAYGPVERVRMSGVRRTTAQTMALSWATIPHVTQADCADITELEQQRTHAAADAAATGGRLTLTAVVVKQVAAAVGIFPKFNASVDSGNDEIVYKKYVNIGVAVDTEHGLLVPVIRDVDKKSLVDVARELRELSARARARKSRPEDLRGANLTVTNLGGLGTTYFSPLINWPEVAVLGIGRARQEAVCRGGGIIPRLILPLSLSYDHRLIDGADAARFLRWLAEALENPSALILET